MRFQIQNQSEPGPELGCILKALVESSLEALHHFSEDPEGQIHLLRTHMKKMRALLQLARAELPAAAFAEIRTAIRTLKQGYANTRDELVLHRLFKNLATSMESAALPDIFDLSHHDPAPPGEALFQAAGHLRDQLAKLPFWAVTATGVRRAFQKTLRNGETLMRECRLLQTDHAFHEWRKSMKALWYQASVLNAPQARPAARVSENLGHANDLANLRLRLHPLPPGTVPVSLQDRLEQSLAAARKKALDRGRKLYDS